MYMIYNIFTQAEGAVPHLASREPDHDNNFGQVVVDLDCGDQEDVGHEGDPNKLWQLDGGHEPDHDNNFGQVVVVVIMRLVVMKMAILFEKVRVVMMVITTTYGPSILKRWWWSWWSS